jgi:hypothetical protein
VHLRREIEITKQTFDLVVASPMRRTLQTALAALPQLSSGGIRARAPAQPHNLSAVGTAGMDAYSAVTVTSATTAVAGATVEVAGATAEVAGATGVNGIDGEAASFSRSAG